MSTQNMRAIALVRGFGDSLVMVHLMAQEFTEGGPNTVFNLSPRWSFTDELLGLVEPYLPKFSNQDAREVCGFRFSYNPGVILSRLQRHFDFTFLDLPTSRTIGTFNYRNLVGERPPIPGKYAVISGDTVNANRTLEPELWAKTAKMVARAGLIPVLIGSSSPTDRHRCEYQADGLDLRNTTSLVESITLLGHAEVCFCIANAVSVISHEVGCKTLCVGRPSSKASYARTYFTGPAEIRVNYDRSKYLEEVEQALSDWLKVQIARPGARKSSYR